MSIPEISVRRPVTVLMAVLAVVIFGALASRRLPVELLPDISYPTVTVQTDYPDAAPVSVEQFVTRPVEEAVGVIPGVREMRSVSRPGTSEVILELDWDQQTDYAALEVREKLGTIQLPREAEPPRVLRFDPSLDPVLRLALAGDRPLDELRQLAERWLKQRFEAVGGVAAARVRGGLDPEIVVAADEDRLAALGLTLDDLARALAAENVNQPGGPSAGFQRPLPGAHPARVRRPRPAAAHGGAGAHRGAGAGGGRGGGVARPPRPRGDLAAGGPRGGGAGALPRRLGQHRSGGRERPPGAGGAGRGDAGRPPADGAVGHLALQSSRRWTR